MKRKVAVLGPGSWGAALARILAENGREVRIWGNKSEQVDEMSTKHTNKHHLPELILPTSVQVTTDLATALVDVDAVLFMVPTKTIRSIAQEVAQHLKAKPIIIHASKGLEQGTHKRIPEVIVKEIPVEKRQGTMVLSGPNHAEEVAVRDITTITAANENLADAVYAQELFMNDYFRVYTNDDVIGAETRATLRNIVALGVGAIHGLGFGDNAKAAIMTRGLAEISRLGAAMGANPLTFIGLSGVGDLIVTCTSVHSRNWRAGNLSEKGRKSDEILENMGMIVEGVSTTKVVYELAQQLEVEMLITETIYNVLYDDEDVQQAAKEIMLRDGKTENEFTFDS